MKTYQVITIQTGGTVIKATLTNGKELYIPEDPANSDYAEYLAYTAWVEAGKKAEDFWTQQR